MIASFLPFLIWAYSINIFLKVSCRYKQVPFLNCKQMLWIKKVKSEEYFNLFCSLPHLRIHLGTHSLKIAVINWRIISHVFIRFTFVYDYMEVHIHIHERIYAEKRPHSDWLEIIIWSDVKYSDQCTIVIRLSGQKFRNTFVRFWDVCWLPIGTAAKENRESPRTKVHTDVHMNICF